MSRLERFSATREKKSNQSSLISLFISWLIVLELNSCKVILATASLFFCSLNILEPKCAMARSTNLSSELNFFAAALTASVVKTDFAAVSSLIACALDSSQAPGTSKIPVIRVLTALNRLLSIDGGRVILSKPRLL